MTYYYTIKDTFTKHFIGDYALTASALEEVACGWTGNDNVHIEHFANYEDFRQKAVDCFGEGEEDLEKYLDDFSAVDPHHVLDEEWQVDTNNDNWDKSFYYVQPGCNDYIVFTHNMTNEQRSLTYVELQSEHILNERDIFTLHENRFEYIEDCLRNNADWYEISYGLEKEESERFEPIFERYCEPDNYDGRQKFNALLSSHLKKQGK